MAYAACTFNPGNKGAQVVLSGGNLVATVTSGTGSVLATNYITGLTYFECVMGATLSGITSIGIARADASLTAQIGAGTPSIAYYKDGTVKINNATQTTIATYAATDRIGVAVDYLNKLIWFRVNNGDWNNAAIGIENPNGAVGGISFASIVGGIKPAWGGAATSSATAAFASGSWTDSAPSGYASIDTLGVSTFKYLTQSKESSFATTPQAGQQTATVPAVRGAVMPGAWFGNTKFYSPAAPAKFVSGVVQENGVPIAGKRVYLYERENGALLGSTISDESGLFSIPALGRTSTMVVAVNGPYNAVIFDRINTA